MVPPSPAVAVIVNVLIANVAVTVVSEVIVIVAILGFAGSGIVTLLLHPTKCQLVSVVAVRVTTVPYS